MAGSLVDISTAGSTALWFLHTTPMLLSVVKNCDLFA
jgi:hypothetical protein